jgi:uncharacterized protein YqgC (DUF456 family)
MLKRLEKGKHDSVLDDCGFIGLDYWAVGLHFADSPGNPLSFLPSLFYRCTQLASFSTEFLLAMAALTIVVTVLDYIVPAWGAKKTAPHALACGRR